MKVTDNISDSLASFGAMLKGCVKILLQSRPVTMPQSAVVDGRKPLIIMGNGPSLRTTIDEYGSVLSTHSLLAVNFAANTPEFKQLKPSYYVLCDPAFFDSDGSDNIRKLWHNINAVDWPMTLFVPVSMRSKLPVDQQSNLTVATFNPVGVDGPEWFERIVFGMRLAMPRPRNVLIPSIMIGLMSGFKEIYITGADHSWMKTLRVSDNNEVISVQPHFYEDDKSEHERVASVYRDVRLHQVIMSFYIAFNSYFAIERYARSIGVRIYNSTPGSFIDAFERRPLSAMD